MDEDDNRVAAVVDVATGMVIAPPIVRALTDKNLTDESIAGYAQWTAVRLDEVVAFDDIRSGVQTIIDRHDALRLLLRRGSDGGTTELIVRDSGAVVAEGLVGEIAGSGDAELIRRTAEESAAQLDPRAGNLLRVVLLRTPPISLIS